MRIKNKSIVVLSSGGLDSSTVAAIAKKSGAKIFGLSFDYGQKHKKELDAARKISDHFAFEDLKIIKLDLSIWGGSSLTDHKQELPTKGLNKNLIPNTYVPGRNTIFIAVALSYAEAINADLVGLGVNALDYSGYPDCRPDYIAKFQQLSNLSNKRGRENKPIRIWTPLINLNKEKIIQLAFDNDLNIDDTWSCYAGGLKPCKKCDSCRIRESAYRKWLQRYGQQ
ncbi:MAG: 7-cyano-7-deazaguanine synthase QueC [Prochlorococcus sp. SP3034]|nr:7-cyano-7-deazaguanine synthase QueC [Prochlorococcus sp. SP3034]|tara:strand:+ start:8019 stop:8693 length:675 start_codon:yes stop_codon:yes gene_type:complete